MLVAKEPNLEKQLQVPLRENLGEIRERCLEDLKHFINELDEAVRQPESSVCDSTTSSTGHKLSKSRVNHSSSFWRSGVVPRVAQRPLEHDGLEGQFMDRWTEPTLQHSILSTNRLQRDKQCYLRGFLLKYVLIFSLKYCWNNLFKDFFLSAFILIHCHHAGGFFPPPFFCKGTAEKEEFDLQTSAANFAVLLWICTV